MIPTRNRSTQSRLILGIALRFRILLSGGRGVEHNETTILALALEFAATHDNSNQHPTVRPRSQPKLLQHERTARPSLPIASK